MVTVLMVSRVVVIAVVARSRSRIVIMAVFPGGNRPHRDDFLAVVVFFSRVDAAFAEAEAHF